MQAVAEKGINKSKMHVLAALTRLRQICCHPKLVGNDSISGKTETLFELLDSLMARSEEHTSELQSQSNLVCRLLLEKKNIQHIIPRTCVPLIFCSRGLIVNCAPPLLGLLVSERDVNVIVNCSAP